MSSDFTTVSEVTIPEGEVVKITDENGNTLWEKTEEQDE